MNQNPQELILRVLEIIEYPGNRFKFSKKFLALCHFKACWMLVERLSEEDQAVIKKKIDKNITPVALKAHLIQMYAIDEYRAALHQASKKLFEDCFSKVILGLDGESKEELKTLMAIS